MVAIQQDGQPAVDNPTGGEVIWRLLTGVAHDSWDAICKHSPVHSSEHETDTTEEADGELKRRAGGGGGGHNNGRGNNNNNNNNGNHGSNGNGGNNNNNNDKKTSSTEAPAKTTPATSTTPAKEASTPAAKTTSTTPEAEKSTAAAAADPTTKATSKEAAASPAAKSTPAADNDKSEPTTVANNNDGNDSGNQTTQDSGTAATAAPSGNSNNDSSNDNNNNNSNEGAAASQTGAPRASAAADAAGATKTGSNYVNSVYVEPNGQTTTIHEQAKPTSSGGGRALGAAATSGSASPTGTSASTGTGSSTSMSGGGSHAGVIAGVVVALALLLIAAALLYRFRRSKALRPLFAACGGNRNGSEGNNGIDGGTQSGAQRLNSRGSVRSLLTPTDALPSAGLPSAGLGGGGPAMSEKMSPTTTGGVFNEKMPAMAMAAGAGVGAGAAAAAAGVHSMNNLPPPTYPPATAARQPSRSGSASSSLDSSDMTPSTASSGVAPIGSAVAAAAATGRARSASRSNYSTFPATGRTNTAYGHHNSNSSVNSVPRLQPVPAQPFAARRGGSGGRAVGQAGNINGQGQGQSHYPAGSLPTPPPTAVQPKEPQYQVQQQQQQQQQQPSLPRLAVATADGIPLNGQPSSQRSPMSRTPAQPLASPSALAPPPLSATSRQRQQRQSAGSGTDPTADEIHEMDASSTDAGGDGSTAQNRSSYGSVGGSSITSSVLMSPGLLQWPVPPQTPPISVRDGGSPEDMMGQGQMPSYMVPGQQSGQQASVARRPLTTSSSGSTTIGRGPMPTRAPLNGPATRSLLQTPVGRRPSLVGGGSAPAGYGHISQQQQKQSYSQPQQHSQQYSQQYSQQRPQQQHPQYQQQQYPQQQRAPMGYMPPQASALTVHTDGQATSVRIPISRYQSPQSPQGRRQDFY